ncbi:hypothetical protein [Aminobacter sp. Piv2-1]|uniref:hypothetical protein n=1 Tax=Aminobacter sp. Piv2-1 TaxID=3031122 RepID=UPI003097587B
MYRNELQKIAADAKAQLEAIKAADTPENEKRLVSLLASRGVKITKLRRKNPARYRATLKNGSMEPVTLHDLEGLLAKLSTNT